MNTPRAILILLLAALVPAFTCFSAARDVTLTERAAQTVVMRGSQADGRYAATVVKSKYTAQFTVVLDQQRNFSADTQVSFSMGDLAFDAALSQALKPKFGPKGSALFVCSATMYNDNGDVSRVVKYATVRIKWTETLMTIKVSGRAKYIDDDSVYFGYGDDEGDFVSYPPLCSDSSFDESIFDGPGMVSDSTSVAVSVADDSWDADIEASCDAVNCNGLVNAKTMVLKYREDGEAYADEYPVTSYSLGGQADWD
ncbi:MAG: hypothetical protein NTV22_08245 [bacterium]|nr:hypothetical protein [bacterium]